MLKDAILVCTDGSDLACKGVRTAVELAAAMKLPVLGLTVTSEGAAGKSLEDQPEAVRSVLSFVQEEARRAGVECGLLCECSDKPWEGINEAARRHDVRFVVMASRGLGSVGSFLLGSQTQKVVATTDRPVLVIR